MRAFTSGILALALSASGVLAAGSDVPLAPGHPAGLKQAEGMSGNTILYVALGAGAIAGIALAVSGDDAAPAKAPTTTTTTTTTTG